MQRAEEYWLEDGFYYRPPAYWHPLVAAVYPQSCIRNVRRNANRRPGVFMYAADGLWKSSPKLILLAAACLQFENRVGDWIPLTAAANGYRLFFSGAAAGWPHIDKHSSGQT